MMKEYGNELAKEARNRSENNKRVINCIDYFVDQ